MKLKTKIVLQKLSITYIHSTFMLTNTILKLLFTSKNHLFVVLRVESGF